MDRIPVWRKPARIYLILAMGALALGRAHIAGAQQPPSQPAQLTAPPQAKKPPFPNRANEVMPTWLRVRGEFRERFEGFTGANFAREVDDAYGLSRLRLNATVTPAPFLSFQVQAQDARVGGKQIGPTGVPFPGTFDLRMAFADVGSTTSQLAARTRTAGTGVRRAAARRSRELAEYGADLRRRARHLEASRCPG